MCEQLGGDCSRKRLYIVCIIFKLGSVLVCILEFSVRKHCYKLCLGMMGDSPKYGGWMNVLVMVVDRPGDGGWPSMGWRVTGDCHKDWGWLPWGYEHLRLKVFLSKIWDRQTDTTMYRVVTQRELIKEAGGGPSSSLLRVWVTDNI